MKFGKSLTSQLEGTLPEWKDKFIAYKELKKRLKLIEPKDFGGVGVKRRRVSDSDSICSTTRAEIYFRRLLEAEVEKFNRFFEEKEEEYIIRLKEFKVRVSKAKGLELVKIHREIVDFHGEMVLLENYSSLNYTGLVKILKKYDKRTGALIRLPFIQKVLQQPFLRMDLLYKLIKECELLLDHLFPIDQLPLPTNMEYIESLFMRSTVSALRALKEIRSGSSTVSAFSLPPLQTSIFEETWNKVPVLD